MIEGILKIAGALVAAVGAAFAVLYISIEFLIPFLVEHF